MSAILRMKKALIQEPKTVCVSGVSVRDFSGIATDIEYWLEIRSLALPIAVGRPWTKADFRREFSSRSWWSSDRMMFAHVEHEEEPIGVIAFGDTHRSTEATIQWLMVAPTHQRQGVATKLLNELERRCWAANRRTVLLETLSSWESAVEFYKAQGYSVRQS